MERRGGGRVWMVGPIVEVVSLIVICLDAVLCMDVRRFLNLTIIMFEGGSLYAVLAGETFGSRLSVDLRPHQERPVPGVEGNGPL